MRVTSSKEIIFNFSLMIKFSLENKIRQFSDLLLNVFEKIKVEMFWEKSLNFYINNLLTKKKKKTKSLISKKLYSKISSL